MPDAPGWQPPVPIKDYLGLRPALTPTIADGEPGEGFDYGNPRKPVELVEDASDLGTYINTGSLTEYNNDLGTYIINFGLTQDSSDPGTYLLAV